MIADALALAGPLHQLTEVLSAEPFVPEPVRDVMRPVSAGLEVAQTLGPPLEHLVTAAWDSLASLGAAQSVEELGRTVGALVESAGEIARVTAVAAEIVVRGTVEVIGIAEQFLARAVALGPGLVTPVGQAALVGLAAEHLVRGIHVVERVQSELRAPTAELRRIQASIPGAPPVPGEIAAGTVHPAGAEGAAAGAGAEGQTASHVGSPAAAVMGEGVEVTLPDGSTATAPNERAATAVRSALTQQGVPYSWGGTSPGVGLDCSGLTQWAYGQSGVELPRLAQEQGIGTPVSQSEIMPGDLAVWDGHVAMCIGNSQMVEAGDPVSVSGVRTDNCGMGFHGFFRPTDGTAT